MTHAMYTVCSIEKQNNPNKKSVCNLTVTGIIMYIFVGGSLVLSLQNIEWV